MGLFKKKSRQILHKAIRTDLSVSFSCLMQIGISKN